LISFHIEMIFPLENDRLDFILYWDNFPSWKWSLSRKVTMTLKTGRVLKHLVKWADRPSKNINIKKFRETWTINGNKPDSFLILLAWF
jgi:hypothetical protein